LFNFSLRRIIKSKSPRAGRNWSGIRVKMEKSTFFSDLLLQKLARGEMRV